ncbi:carbamoyl-phosphate synthase (glutamine-hydrolyzing) large subunit [Salisediminibacterium halotolerans]|uniref:Carbamoyl phosphate synthase large chain n=1 Tax=Salisediminibacterium halotolerans TaxID=517425 RepID=A0A1H9RP21_9BACI|nr:carbamoyl-phosphate synthase (glutamine-hydrolyzing) large subunit [Salisediminibacterium haloalkalitolerans]SER74512.1 carbamoyl-phosphate synthase large subunit [Salisediminibacterium haloalkalitolerans]
MGEHGSIKKVLVVGSGPIVIGQAAEFDYAGTQACLALKEEGIEVVLLNNNPATIMTDDTIADSVYFEPLTAQSVEYIFQQEKPDGMIGTLGGQTGLNVTVDCYNSGLFEKYNVKLLGTSVEAIRRGEDRDLFRELMIEVNEPIAESHIVESVDEGISFVEQIGYPVILRPAYTLGGAGGGFCYNEEELRSMLKHALHLSPIHQVLVEKSIKGWKEVEYEVMRDHNDTCTIVCNMENMDPVGVHTGDSIVTAPSQTLTDNEYQILRSASLNVIRALNVVGGCNIQFAVEPATGNYVIIEVNPRVSRSSALASKATGYPIARIAAKCALGYALDEIINPITGSTYASFEPALDYIVVKLPRFPFDKFPEADRELGTQMKATGEVMAIDRTFEGALNKAVRSLEQNTLSVQLPGMKLKDDAWIEEHLKKPNDQRLFVLSEAIRRGNSEDDLHQITEIDRWFLRKVNNIVMMEEEIRHKQHTILTEETLKKIKRLNISDEWIADTLGMSFAHLREIYESFGLNPAYKLVDTCAGEFDAETPYYYSTWQGRDEAVREGNKKRILVLGSGPIRIGQGIEFDYCSVHAAEAVKKLGHEAIVINNNPETVSTDYTVADRLYFEPLALEDVYSVARTENIDGVIVQFGGQTAINLADSLKKLGFHVLGTSPANIDRLEDRDQFYQMLNEYGIDHITGSIAYESNQLLAEAKKLGYPVLIRPSYVIGGQSMFICYDDDELIAYSERIQEDTADRCWPLLVDQYVPGKECEVDVISDGNDIVIPGIFEHLEKAGVHSGDSVTIFPSVSLTAAEKNKITEISRTIAKEADVIGMMNIQFVLHQGTIYVLEVNPRSSRTVPIMSKVTGVKMIEHAVQSQLGIPLNETVKETDLMKEPNFYTVKAPVFSAPKLKGVDHVLGPEMKSTGELIGLSTSKERAMAKAFHAMKPKKDPEEDKWRVFLSLSDRMKDDAKPYIQALLNSPVTIFATEGTAEWLSVQGYPADHIYRTKKELSTLFKEYPPHIVLNIASQGRQKEKTGFFIRELAVRFDVPYFTSLDTFKAMSDVLIADDVNERPLALHRYLAASITADAEVNLND